jgi:ABC-type branched-subunit amino acid transport system ATPase component/ABC-type branched-subunit amino acid transport system permease subunit
MLAAQLLTSNLLLKGVVGGFIIALVAMGIVLVYRSSRVINFAVGSLGLPATALFAIMAGKHGWPYWLALVLALLIGTLSGTVVELAVIRRLFHVPRVIVLVATIGVAQLAQAVTLSLPDFRTGSLQTQFPLPFEGEWHPGFGLDVGAAQLLILIVVPLVVLALWWLLNHTTFGDQVRAASSNADLARMTGISPKLVSTAVWSIAGFLSALAVLLTATDRGSTELVSIGPETLLRGLAAALIGGMVSFPRAALGAVLIGVGERVLTFHYTDDSGLVQFVLLILVVILVARVSRTTETGGESFQFAPRVPAVPERLRNIWWVRRLPQLLGLLVLVVAVVAPLTSDLSARHQVWAVILSYAVCATSVVVLTGWAGQLSLGQMAFGGIAALTAATLARGLSVDIGWREVRVLDGSLHAIAFPWTVLIGAAVACVVAVLIGIGALRVRGLLLAVSTLAFAIAAQAYVFRRPFFTGGRSTVQLPRADLGPFELTHRNRAYYYLVLLVLVVVLLALGHLRRSGVGRMIVGVRENEQAAAAMTISPARVKLTAFAVAGFVAGLGGALLAGIPTTFGPAQRYFLVEDSIALVAMVVVGGLGSLSGAVVGAVWIIGLPAFWPDNDLVPLLTSSIGLLLILLYLPGGFAQIGYWVRDQLFAALERRLPAVPVKTVTVPPASLTRVTPRHEAGTEPDGSVLATDGLTVSFGGLVALDRVEVRARAGEVIGLIGNNGAGKSTLLNAIGAFVPSRGAVHLLGRDVSHEKAYERARLGLGRTFQAATLYPELSVRETVQLALEARHRTSFWATLVCAPSSMRSERAKRAEAAELIDFLGLGRYADRHVVELSTGTRRIVELATVLAVAPRVICLDEPTAGVAQREAEAFGPLITRVQKELDATLIVVEHDLPMVLSISDRVYCMEAGRVIAEGPPDEVRNDPRVISSYLGTDERAILRSSTPPA